MKCRVCETTFHETRPIPVCADCTQTLGLREMPTSTRPRRPCDKCGGTKLVRVIPRESITTPGETGSQYMQPIR